MCFAPLTLEPAADQLITILVVVIREKVKIHDTLVGRKCWVAAVQAMEGRGRSFM